MHYRRLALLALVLLISFAVLPVHALVLFPEEFPDVVVNPTPAPEPSEGPVPVPEPSEDPVPSPEPSEEPVPAPEPSEDPVPVPEPSEDPVPVPEPSLSVPDYLPPDRFFDTFDDYSVQVLAVQTTPNSPVTSSSGLKGIMLSLLGPYDPVIVQYRYQSNTSTNYTYVNDISPDYPWLCSAAIFAIVLYCTFKLGGTFFCKI